jgi:hypothetical protein
MEQNKNKHKDAIAIVLFSYYHILVGWVRVTTLAFFSSIIHKKAAIHT